MWIADTLFGFSFWVLNFESFRRISYLGWAPFPGVGSSRGIILLCSYVYLFPGLCPFSFVDKWDVIPVSCWAVERAEPRFRYINYRTKKKKKRKQILVNVSLCSLLNLGFSHVWICKSSLQFMCSSSFFLLFAVSCCFKWTTGVNRISVFSTILYAYFAVSPTAVSFWTCAVVHLMNHKISPQFFQLDFGRGFWYFQLG